MRIALIFAVTALLLSGAAALAQSSAQSSGQSPGGGFPMPPPEPTLMTTPGGRDVPARIGTDRHTRCMQYGASIAVPADQMDAYIKRCVLQ